MSTADSGMHCDDQEAHGSQLFIIIVVVIITVIIIILQSIVHKEFSAHHIQLTCVRPAKLEQAGHSWLHLYSPSQSF